MKPHSAAAWALAICLAITIAEARPQQAAPKSIPTPEPAPAYPKAGQAAAGEVIYGRYCVACHGTALEGNGPLAPALKTRPPDLTVLSRKNRGTFPFDRVVAFIDGRERVAAHGSPDMPIWGEVFPLTEGTDAATTEEAVSRLAHYVWSRQKVDRPVRRKK